jgi:hypothetical protein
VSTRRLGPRSLADILDETIRVYRRGYLIFIGAMAMLLVPLAILMVPAIAAGVAAFAGGDEPEPSAIVALIGIGTVIILAFIVGIILSGGAATQITSDILTGIPPSVGHGYRVALSRLGSLLGASILLALAMLGIVIVTFPLLFLFVIGWLTVPIGLIVWFANPSARAPWLKWLIILTCPFGLALYYGYRWSLFAQAIVLEGYSASAALRRSTWLVQGHWWHVFLTLFLVGLMVSVLQAIPQAIFTAIGTAIAAGGDSAQVVGQVVSQLGNVLGWIVFGAVNYITMTLLYLDLRVRKEAYDLEQMATNLGVSGESSGS